MDYFPIFVDLRGKRCLVVGGGMVAARKAESLVRAGAFVHVVAPQLSAAVRELASSGKLAVTCAAYQSAQLTDVELVVAATDDSQVNASVSRDARALRLLVNVVDCPALSTFIVPALVDRSPVIVAVSSAGTAPVLARTLRGKLEASIPARYGVLGGVCARLRGEVKTCLPTVESRRAFWELALDSAAAERALAGDEAGAEHAMRELLAEFSTGASGTRAGELVCIGAGPGDPELISFRAQRAMLRAEWVLYADDVPSAIVGLCRRDAERVRLASPVASSFAKCLPELVTRVQRGQRVCVIARGDWFRTAAGEACLHAARSHGLAPRIVPGIAE